MGIHGGCFLYDSIGDWNLFPPGPKLAEAQREGKVVWYTGAALFTAERVAKLFEQAYPGIKVEIHRSGSERILRA